MTKHPDLFAALAAPFEPHEVKVRTQAGRQLHYVTARTVMNRLDNVVGPENWWDDYTPGENSVLCRLTIRMPDGSTLTKADAGGYAGMSDEGDDDKSGYSDAFKRAAVKFGIARYLYRDGVPSYVGDAQDTASAPAPRPAPAHPDAPAQPRKVNPTNPPHPDAPATGRALFGWAKDVEKQYDVGIIKYLQNFGKLQEFGGHIVSWNRDQVAVAYAEACRKLESLAVAS